MKKVFCLLISLMMILSLFTACGDKSGETVVTVGEEKISEGEVLFVIANMVESTKSQFSAMGMTDEQQKEYWQTDMDGKKPADLIREMAASEAINYAVFAQAAKDAGITVTSGEVDTKFSQIFSNDSVNMLKDTYGVSKSSIKSILRKEMFRDKYVSRVLSKEAGYNPTEEQLLEIFYADYLKAQHILITTTDSETGAALAEEELAEKENLAKSLLKRAKGGENFDELMLKYGEDPGVQGSPTGYVFTEGEMVTEFYEGAKALKEGEISDLVKTSYGYHIIKRVPMTADDMTEKTTTITTAFQSEFQTKKLEELKSKYKVSQDDELLGKITVKTGF